MPIESTTSFIAQEKIGANGEDVPLPTKEVENGILNGYMDVILKGQY